MDNKAQGALEYLLLIGGAILIAAVVITLLTGLGGGGGGYAHNAESTFHNAWIHAQP
jgi:uncharacterized protein (UPF0333 family)